MNQKFGINNVFYFIGVCAFLYSIIILNNIFTLIWLIGMFFAFILSFEQFILYDYKGYIITSSPKILKEIIKLRRKYEFKVNNDLLTLDKETFVDIKMVF